MKAMMAPSAWRTTAMTIERCLLVILVLSALAPVVGWADVAEIARNREQAAEDQRAPANTRGQHAAPKRTPVKARPQPRNDAAAPSSARGSRRGRAATAAPTAVATAPSNAVSVAPVSVAGTAAPAASAAAPAAAGGTQNPHAAVTRHFTPNAPGALNLTGVTGNTAARRASVPEVVGGPAKYDAKKGAIVSGTVARQKR